MIIVTGGAGFIGSNIVKFLNDKGINDILIVDSLGNNQKFMNLKTLNFIDIVDKNEFLNKINMYKKDISSILHQGACSDTTVTDGNYILRNNYEYSKDLLHFAIINKVQFIYASSASVYGDGKNGFKELKTSENPLNLYAFSKFLFDEYVRKLNNCETQITGLRYFNVYGPQENHKREMASVMYHFYHQAKNEKKIKVFEGSEKYIRDFIYVKDICNIIYYFMQNRISGIFNCGTGEAYSFFEVANYIRDYFTGVSIEEIPFPNYLIGKYQKITKADISALRKCGYFYEFTNIKQGINDYLNILEKNNGYLKFEE